MVTNINKWIPLIVLCGITTKPWSYSFQFWMIQYGIKLVAAFKSEIFLVQLHHSNWSLSQLHIIQPIIFGIDIWRSYRSSLCYSFFTSGKFISGFGFNKKSSYINTIIVYKDLITQRKSTCKLRRRRTCPRCIIHKLSPLLRFTT